MITKSATRDLGRSVGGGGAGIARLGQLFVVDITGGHLVAVLDEMLEHRKPHAPDAHDADALLLPGCHWCPLCVVDARRHAWRWRLYLRLEHGSERLCGLAAPPRIQPPP